MTNENLGSLWRTRGELTNNKQNPQILGWGGNLAKSALSDLDELLKPLSLASFISNRT